MPVVGWFTPTVARTYFALQALAGAAWWVLVAASDDVQHWTLGQWDPAIMVGPDLVLFVGASAVAALNSKVAAIVATVWTTALTIVLVGYGLVEREAGWGCVFMAIATVGSWAATATMWFGAMPTRWFFVGPFSFRVADDAPGARHLRRSLVQLVVFWTAFFVVLPLVLAAIEARLRLSWPALDGMAEVGIASFVVASALGLWSCVTMALRGLGTPLPAATARDLVIAGPYRWVRNPMALAGMVQTIGVGLWIGSWMVIATAVAGALAWNTFIRPVEEADLRARFGTPYERYADRIRCWIPSRAWRGA